MHPQAIVIDASAAEEPYFQAGMRKHAKDKKTPLIELPRNGAKRLGWLTKLDSASLARKLPPSPLSLSLPVSSLIR